MKTISDQRGFVSIFSALIIMLLIALITVGFTYSTNQSIRRTLDDQLNTQAFYAAESGINDAVEFISSNPNTNKDTCDGGAGFSYDIDTELGISYTCVLIDTTTETQQFDDVPVEGTGGPVVANLESESGDDIVSLVFEWDSSQAGSNPRTGGFSGNIINLPNTSTWGSSIGVLRVDVISVEGIGNTTFSRQNLANNTYSFFLYPTNTGSGSVTVNNGQARQGAVIPVNCNNSGFRCRAVVRLGGAGSNHYRARIQSLYNPVNVHMEALNASSSRLTFINGQAAIDSTGRANDVFRRIQVHIPLNDIVGYSVPFTIDSASSICKRLQVSDGTGAIAYIGGSVPNDECNVD